MKTKNNNNNNNNDADNVVAATAGIDNWKTWAGRQHGSENFEVLDVFRGMRRSINARFLLGKRPPKHCPVCFCEDNSGSDGDGDDETAMEWHWTSSCQHAVCMDCFRAYARNQVKDFTQSGPLKCPCCPMELRRSDAIIALAGDKELIDMWDKKIRNQLLRALPAYRSCPRCSGHVTDENENEREGGGGENRDDESGNNKKKQNTHAGGGFVTPECLTPHYLERRDDALSRIKQGALVTVLCTVSVYLCLAHYVNNNPSKSIAVDIFFLLSPMYIIFGKTSGIAQRWTAQWARSALFRPILVECPCCTFEFILPASAETIHDEETKKWLNDNTRLCPSCSVPITKNGGCNHMRCLQCHSEFCWACMRTRTRCGAYQCRNGGENAVPVTAANRQQQQGGGEATNNHRTTTVLARIDQILERRPVEFHPRDGLVLFSAMFMRDFQILQVVVGCLVKVFAYAFTTGFITVCVLGFTIYSMSKKAYNDNRRRRQQQEGQPNHNNHHDIFRPRNHRTEAAMIAEAIRRSIEDQ